MTVGRVPSELPGADDLKRAAVRFAIIMAGELLELAARVTARQVACLAAAFIRLAPEEGFLLGEGQSAGLRRALSDRRSSTAFLTTPE